MKTTKIVTALKTAIFALAAAAVALGLASPADAVSGTMYGDPIAAAKYWQSQKYDDCVLMSSADIVGQLTGKEPSERSIIKVAQSTPSVVHPGSIYIKPADTKNPNSGMGTSVADIPTLLAHYGVDVVLTDLDNAVKHRRRHGHGGTRAAPGQRPQGDRQPQRRNDLGPARRSRRPKTAVRSLTTRWS